MHNELFSIGPFVVHGYGLMIAIGVIYAFCTAMFRAKKKGLDKEFVFDLGFNCMIAGFIGTRLLYYIVELPNIINDPSILWDFKTGYVVYGGIIGGVGMGLIYCKWKKKNFLDYFDLVMPSIILAQAFGRIGCFLAGCCYGKETDAFYGVVFSHSSYAPAGVKLIPTQLISSAGNFVIYFILILYARKTRKRGRVGAMYLILYSIGRFFVEFLRNDYRGSIGILSTSQIISIGTLLLGIILFAIAKGKNEKQIDEDDFEEEDTEESIEESEETEDDSYEVVEIDRNEDDSSASEDETDD